MLADDTKRRPRNPLAFLRGSLFNKSAPSDATDDERDGIVSLTRYLSLLFLYD